MYCEKAVALVSNVIYSHHHVFFVLQHTLFLSNSNYNICWTYQLTSELFLTGNNFCMKRMQKTWKQFFSLHHDISHGFDVFVSIIWCVFSHVSTRVRVIRVPSGTKPDSGVTAFAIIFVVSNETDSCFRMVTSRTHSIEPCLVTVALQGGL